MTLLITVIAALVTSVIWYTSSHARKMQVGTLALFYWGASLMWTADAIFEYAEDGAEFFMPAGVDMLNDAFLGLSAVALGLIIWLIILLVKDPDHVVREALLGRVTGKA